MCKRDEVGERYRFIVANLVVLCVGHLGSLLHVLDGLGIDVRRQLLLHFLLFHHLVLFDQLLLDHLGLRFVNGRLAGLGRSGRSRFLFQRSDIISARIQLVQLLVAGFQFLAFVATALVFLSCLLSLTLAFFFCKQWRATENKAKKKEKKTKTKT